jgi:hypothetical protein
MKATCPHSHTLLGERSQSGARRRPQPAVSSTFANEKEVNQEHGEGHSQRCRPHSQTRKKSTKSTEKATASGVVHIRIRCWAKEVNQKHGEDHSSVVHIRKRKRSQPGARRRPQQCRPHSHTLLKKIWRNRAVTCLGLGIIPCC